MSSVLQKTSNARPPLLTDIENVDLEGVGIKEWVTVFLCYKLL